MSERPAPQLSLAADCWMCLRGVAPRGAGGSRGLQGGCACAKGMSWNPLRLVQVKHNLP